MLKPIVQVIIAVAISFFLASFATAPLAHADDFYGNQERWRKQAEQDMQFEKQRLELRKTAAEIRYIDALADKAVRDRPKGTVNTNMAVNNVTNTINTGEDQ